MGVEAAIEEVGRLLAARPGDVEHRDDVALVTVGDRALEVEVLPFGPDSAVVQVMTPLLVAVADRDELCEELATVALTFTRPLVFDDEQGRNVLLVTRFHANQLRADVLEHAIAVVAADADRLDPELEARFGATWTLEEPS